MHTYATVLATNQADNVLRIITPPVIEYLFGQLLNSESEPASVSVNQLEIFFCDKKIVYFH